jgi:hypothetical protein
MAGINLVTQRISFRTLLLDAASVRKTIGQYDCWKAPEAMVLPYLSEVRTEALTLILE